jgi:hypothetical protein
MGANFYVAGFDLSGDTNSITSMSGGPKLWDTTDITQLGHSRLGLQRDGSISWVSFFDPAAGAEHAWASSLPVTDQVVSCFLNPLAVGSPAINQNSKLVAYETKRAAGGELTVDFECESNGFGLEANGIQLTPGKRTDTSATNGPSVNDLAATTNGAQGYLQVFAFTGTDVTIKVQDSADNVTFTDVAGFSWNTVTSAPQAIRDSVTGTLRQYVRCSTTTVGGFTSCTFAVSYHRNPVAVNF